MAARVAPPLAFLLLTGPVASQWTKSGQYQYLLYNTKVNWSQGLNFCTHEKLTAFMARPTHGNAAFLKSFGVDSMYWADHSYNGTRWVWSDGSPLPAGDVSWYSGYPKQQSTATRGLYDRKSTALMNTDPSYLKFPVVCQAPLDKTTAPPTTTPQPATTTPLLTTTTPQQTTTKLETTTNKPEPTTTAPRPTTTKPEPTTTEPQPTTTQPEPTTTKPEPTTTKPETTTTVPQPTTTKPELTSTPEPTITKPEPTPTATPTTSPTVCPSSDGWVLAMEDGRCYYLSSQDPAAAQLTWAEASRACADLDASLASVPDRSTFYAVSFQVSAAGGDAWTGLLDVPAVGPSWSDGSPYNTELDQFLVKDPAGTYGYLSAADGQFHLADGTATRAFVCSTAGAAPTPSTGSTTTASPCPAGWQQDGQTCYLFSEVLDGWTGAAHRCHELGATLVTISESSQLLFLVLQADDHVFWSGLQNERDVYVWQDGSPVDTDILEPYLDEWQLGKDCVVISKSGYPELLIHDDCFAQHRFVCQKPSV